MAPRNGPSLRRGRHRNQSSQHNRMSDAILRRERASLLLVPPFTFETRHRHLNSDLRGKWLAVVCRPNRSVEMPPEDHTQPFVATIGHRWLTRPVWVCLRICVWPTDQESARRQKAQRLVAQCRNIRSTDGLRSPESSGSVSSSIDKQFATGRSWSASATKSHSSVVSH